MSKYTRKQIKKLKEGLDQQDQTKRMKGEPIFGNTPYGSKGGKPNKSGFRAPQPKWDNDCKPY